MIIVSLRTYLKDKTTASIFVDGDYFDDSLEDAGRGPGVKVQDETCIPEGTYKVAISYSNKFGRDMMVIYNTDDDHSINRFGVRFTGIRVHSGRTIEHTAGCPLVSKYSRLQGMVKNALERGEEVLWVFTEEV